MNMKHSTARKNDDWRRSVSRISILSAHDPRF